MRQSPTSFRTAQTEQSHNDHGKTAAPATPSSTPSHIDHDYYDDGLVHAHGWATSASHTR
jgi:hypothetical protein